jgi:hypothetical protein
MAGSRKCSTFSRAMRSGAMARSRATRRRARAASGNPSARHIPTRCSRRGRSARQAMGPASERFGVCRVLAGQIITHCANEYCPSSSTVACHKGGGSLASNACADPMIMSWSGRAGPPAMSARRSLSGVSRTRRGQPNLVEIDPQRTSPSLGCRSYVLFGRGNTRYVRLSIYEYTPWQICFWRRFLDLTFALRGRGYRVANVKIRSATAPRQKNPLRNAAASSEMPTILLVAWR